MRATQIDESLQNEFEDVPKLSSGENLRIIAVEFGESPKQKLACATILLAGGEKRFTTGAKVIGQLRSEFYANLISKAVEANDSLEVKVETVKANTGRDMLSLNIF